MAEILALGAAKAAGAAGAGAALVKLGNDLESVARSSYSNADDGQDLREQLRSAHHGVDIGHREATTIWRSPLSLFDDKSVDADVPLWAVRSVLEAQALVEEAAELGDLTDVYEAQIVTAENERRLFLHAPVCKLINRLDDLRLRLNTHLPCLAAARKAFDAPTEAVRESPLGPPMEAALEPKSTDDIVVTVDLPLAILETKSDLIMAVRSSIHSIGNSVTSMNSKAAHSLNSMNQTAWQSLQQVAQTTSGAERKEEENDAPVELSSYALQYL